QGKLDGGFLRGELEVRNVSDDVLTVIQANSIGKEEYIAFGKRVIKLIYPPVSKLVRILRTNFGQYWLQEIDTWDSRRQTLGSYCSNHRILWSSDRGANWQNFVPDERTVYIHGATITVGGTRFDEFLTQGDWEALKTWVDGDYEP